MNDENFLPAVERAVAPPDPPDDRQRSGLRFKPGIRLPRAVGVRGIFLPVAAVLNCRILSFGGWWRWSAGLCLAHLAWQWAAKTLDRYAGEIYNLKVDAISPVCGLR